jgi:hypothetical protein
MVRLSNISTTVIATSPTIQHPAQNGGSYADYSFNHNKGKRPNMIMVEAYDPNTDGGGWCELWHYFTNYGFYAITVYEINTVRVSVYRLGSSTADIRIKCYWFE